MLKIYRDIHQIAAEFKGILLDAYGVFWGGNDYGPLPNAKEAMAKLIEDGKVVGILSNSSQLAAKEIHKLQMHGFIQGLHFHFLLTSGEVARSIFFNEALPFPTPKKKFWVFGGIHPRFSSHAPLFYETSYTETSDVEKADFIHIGIPHIGGEDQTNPEVFRQFLEPLRKIDLPMICVNPDCFAHEGNPPRAVVRQGTIAALFESLGGKVHYIGKPYEKGFSLAMDLFRQQKIQSFKEVIMVGDTPETDIRGARNFGLASALITQTGVAADRIRQQGLENVLRSLPQSDYPNFLVERLANDV